MAKLFKDKQIKKELEGYKIPNFEKKLDLIRGWKRVYDSKELHKKTESQCEQAFNDDFFVKILDYVKFPAEKYSIDPKSSTESSGQRPDAILGIFEGDSRYVKAVVEIKDVNTPLDKSQRREGNFSPIQQAFKYKPQFKGCAFVIATNFFEIRLFKENQLDYEIFTLDSLVDPKDDYYQFKKFYFLLNFNNFVNQIGQSNTEKLLAHIVIEQESITKAFYKHYSSLRQELIKDIVKNNKISRNDWVGIVEKAQKLIDRIVFICFCEDLDLLPEGKLEEVIYHTERLGLIQPVWDTLKGFFRAIDKGSEKLEIPEGYNGELFKDDLVLENLKISDEICKKFVELGHFDFSEDLSVNILGHIFEQSITDVEEIKSVGIEDFETGKTVSKRKKEGIFYTPDYIVDYIVKNTVGTLLDKKYAELTIKHGLKEDIKDKNYEKRSLKVYEEYQQYLRGLKILDPACGSGAFLVKVYDFLYTENVRVSNLITDLSAGTKTISMENYQNYIKTILEDNIYGVDLNSESVDITKLSLWLKTAIKGHKLVSLGNNIRVGNSVIDDIDFAGEKAFDWKKNFKEIFDAKGGFDVVLGNPPYVRQELISPYKPYFQARYKVFSGTTDLFAYFYEKGLSLLNPEGFMGYISNTFAKTTGAGEVLRAYLQDNSSFVQMVDFGTTKVFQGVTTYPIILVLSKGKSGIFKYVAANKDDLMLLSNALIQKGFEIEQGALNASSWSFESKPIAALRDRLNNFKTIKDLFGRTYRGILTGYNEAFIIDSNKKKELERKDPKSAELIKPLLEGKDISKWRSQQCGKYLIFTRRGVVIDEYEAVKAHLEGYRQYLTPRNNPGSEVGRKPGKYQWYEIQDSVDYYLKFEGGKIIWPNLQSDNKFCWDEKGNYINAPAVILPTDNKWLLGILNSNVVWFFLQGICARRSGGFIEVKPQYFQQIPIPGLDDNKKASMGILVNEIIDLNSEILTQVFNFKELIRHEYNMSSLPRRLDNFWKSDFEVLLKYIEVAQGKLSLSKKDELIQVYNQYKEKINQLCIKVADLELINNKLAYAFYNLSDGEVVLIEQHLIHTKSK
ncbi:MAG: N-6 DNA methylase [Candidatus Margulisbacteria bacterium]|nr:N-6 DNA methylase [Candidatus Margulisiibacteriota bacterium]